MRYGYFLLIAVYTVLAIATFTVLRRLARIPLPAERPARSRMTLANVVAAAMFAGVTLYALLAGADFGAGFWDLVAGPAGRADPRADRGVDRPGVGSQPCLVDLRARDAVDRFPECVRADHVDPVRAAHARRGRHHPARVAAFAFRKASRTLSQRRLFGAAFASSSVITPYFLGAVVGGVASGRVPAGTRTGDVFSSWCNPTSVLGGVMAVVVCAFLAAVYLAADADRRGHPDLVDAFRKRAFAAGIAGGVVAAAGVIVLHSDAPTCSTGSRIAARR